MSFITKELSPYLYFMIRFFFCDFSHFVWLGMTWEKHIMNIASQVIINVQHKMIQESMTYLDVSEIFISIFIYFSIIDAWIRNKYMRKLFTPPDSSEPWELLSKGKWYKKQWLLWKRNSPFLGPVPLQMCSAENLWWCHFHSFKFIVTHVVSLCSWRPKFGSAGTGRVSVGY